MIFFYSECANILSRTPCMLRLHLVPATRSKVKWKYFPGIPENTNILWRNSTTFINKFWLNHPVEILIINPFIYLLWRY